MTGQGVFGSLGLLRHPLEVEAQLGGGFTGLDWLIVGLALLAITILGERLTGKQESIRDFYLGGRSLPWYAVSASIIKTAGLVVPLSAPLQPTNAAPASGCAVRVTASPQL